ncbi:MAG: hypothetical protein ACI398_02305 [Clostridium sp.]
MSASYSHKPVDEVTLKEALNIDKNYYDYHIKELKKNFKDNYLAAKLENF